MILRGIFALASLVAFGALAAAILFVVLGGFVAQEQGGSFVANGTTLQLPSIMLGVGIGLILGLAMRFPWSDLPRRVVTWVLIHERDFFNLGIAAAALAILLLY